MSENREILISLSKERFDKHGTLILNYSAPEDLKAAFKKFAGWKRWNNKKFNDYLVDRLHDCNNSISKIEVYFNFS